MLMNRSPVATGIGIWSATQIEEKTNGQSGSTLLIINRGSAKANLNLGDFSPERITHF